MKKDSTYNTRRPLNSHLIPLLEFNVRAIFPRMGSKYFWSPTYKEVIFRYSRYGILN